MAKPSERIGAGYRAAKATLRGGRVVSGVGQVTPALIEKSPSPDWLTQITPAKAKSLVA